MSEESGKNLRRRRSEETQQAIIYQLEHVQDEFDLELLLLADEHGLVIGHAGDQEIAEVFAVYARPLAEGQEPDDVLRELVPTMKDDHLLCESISLDNIPMYLLAIMDPTPENCHAYERVRTGIQRIYYSTSELAGDNKE